MADGLHITAVRVVEKAVARSFLSSGIHFLFLFSFHERVQQSFSCVSEMLSFSFMILPADWSETLESAQRQSSYAEVMLYIRIDYRQSHATSPVLGLRHCGLFANLIVLSHWLHLHPW